MSIKAMTWAFALPLEPRAKIALLAIADNARDDGVAWPSRDTVAAKSSQSRATVNRRLRILSELGVLEVKERFREDGTQTTDEIRLDLSLTPEEVGQRVKARKKLLKGGAGEDDGDDEDDDPAVDDADASPRGGGVPVDTLPVHSGHPGAAVVTGGGLHSGNPQDEPSLEPETPPNPPPGGMRADDGPLKKPDKAAVEKRDQLWRAMLGVYPGIADMDQQAGRTEFDKLAIDDCEWAVGVAPLYAKGCDKLRKPPKGVHLWLRKAMFRNYPRGGPPPPSPDSFALDSPEGQAIRALYQIARKPLPELSRARVTWRGEITPQLLAFAQAPPRSAWRFREAEDQIAAWVRFVRDHVPGPWPEMRDSKGIGRETRRGVHAPWPFPPNKDGTIHHDIADEGDNTP